MIANSIKKTSLIAAIKKFRIEFSLAALFSLIANLLMVVPSIYMLQIFDRVMLSRNESSLILLTCIVIFLLILMAMADNLRAQLLIKVNASLDQELNSKIFKLSFDEFLMEPKSSPMEAFTDFINIRQFLTGTGIIVLFDLPWIPIYVALIFFMHHWLGYLVIIFCFIQLSMAYIGFKMTQPSKEKLVESDTLNRNFLNAKLKNFEPVAAMGMLPNLRVLWNQYNNDLQSKWAHLGHKLYVEQGLVKFVRYAMQTFTLASGALLVIDGQLNPGVMVASNFLIARALSPLDQLVSSWSGFVSAKTSYFRLNDLFEKHKESDLNNKVRSEIVGEVRLENLYALSSQTNKEILKDINLSFKPGQVTGIIGHSGSGKSTLARCLIGVWPNTKGFVFIDDQAIQDWDRSILGPAIGYLPQDVELLDGTIAENIFRFYKPDFDKVIEAAKLAGIHEMILRLPRGYDTLIGESGSYLSGGQKQRIGLARALYGSPQFVVLDEPNANLDDAGEQFLYQAVQSLKNQGKTIFFITHRHSILALADYLLVMTSGTVFRYGKKDDVLLEMQQNNK